MNAEQAGAFFVLVSVCSGLGSILSLLLLLANAGTAVWPQRNPRWTEMYAARGHAGGIL